ncbi:unnamed protein product [Rhodiola kirilowii]
MTHHPSRSVRSRRSYLSLLCVGTNNEVIDNPYHFCALLYWDSESRFDSGSADTIQIKSSL